VDARREKEQILDADLEVDRSTYGCEVTYESRVVTSESELDRVNGIDEIEANQENKQCRRSSLLGLRPISGYPFLNVSVTPDWIPLFTFMLDDNTNATTFDVGNSTDNNSTRLKNSSFSVGTCTLCLEGQRPEFPDKEIMDAQGLDTGWSCDEMDAWIPVIFSDPDLVNMDRAELHSCKSYRKYFGRICGCPSWHNCTKNAKIVP